MLLPPQNAFDPIPDHAPLARRSTPALRRSGSSGTFASARDSKFWLAVAVASKSSGASSASSSGSSFSGSLLFNAPTKGTSLLDLLADDDQAAVHGRLSPRGNDDFGLAITVEDDVVKVEEEDNSGHNDSEDRAAPITSPPPLSMGVHRPTILQNHRHRERLGSDWRASSPRSSTSTATSGPGSAGSRSSETKPEGVVAKQLPAPDSLIKPPERKGVPPETEIAVEEVYEHQRYQLVLGWGSKGHLMPMDPGKYVRVVRTPEQLQSIQRRRPSLSRYDDIQVFPSATFPDISLPDAPSDQMKWGWISPWHLEYPVTASTVSVEDTNDDDQPPDNDGWIYATSFNQFTSWRYDSSSSINSSSQIMTDDVCLSPMPNSRGRPKLNVRRRKWIRYRRLRLTASDANTDESCPSPFDDSFLDSMCGWLRKMGHVRKNWKMRYFVLEKSVLRYYADEAMTRLKGEVLLFHPAAKVHYVDIHLANGRDNTFAIQVGPEYTLLLEADKVSDRENWMYCIEDALLCRDSYLQDPTRTQDVRESVARRRNFSSETILYSTNGSTSSSSGINPINMLMLHSKSVVQATRKNPLMMRLMVECDSFLESKQLKQQIAAFIQKFKQKYGGGVVNSGNSQISKTMSPMATPCGNRRRTSCYEGVATRGSDVSVIQDPRSLLALKNYRFFLERAMAEVMEHLTSLPFANASCSVTSPANSASSNGRSRLPSGDPATCESPPMSGEIDWELAKKAALYKLERQTFVPLQDIIYSLLEANLDSDDLDRFEWNRRYLGKQSQRFFEIQESQLSPSDWKSARALLDSMDNYSLPTEKASILLEVAKCIYETYGTEHAIDVKMLAADDFLPIFIYILARSRLRNVVVARHLISETMISGVMIGETGYYATMFEAAVSYIASLFTGEESEDQLLRATK